ncbi:osteoclast stimulatory transmembrane protein [Brachyhypopomus gauderio]|uniref:osteoclast stimulatory transmembrane protein n=1 Tax=Brachyhypopomus gauderio TaxID=698409 RepID=UPI0040410B11
MSLWNTFRTSLRLLWFSYSTPSPQNATQIFILLLFCLVISAVMGALLFYWLNGPLMYEMRAAAVIAGIFAGTMAVLSFLVHPLRCVVTIMFPTLGTRQGRKIVLSMCAMTVALYVLPNTATNITAITHLMKCMSENYAHSILNSSVLCNSIKNNMISEVQKIQGQQVKFVEFMQKFNRSADINVVKIRERLRTLSKDVEEDISKAKQQLEKVRLLASRVLAAFFVLYLLMESTMYLMSYLTSLRFDNVYITGQLRRMAADRSIQVEAKDVKNGINSTSFRMAKTEMIKCIVPALVITLYLLMTTILVLLDHIVHYLVKTGGTWLADMPSTDITMQMDFKLAYQNSIMEFFGYYSIQENLSKVYSVTVGSDASRCKAQSSELDRAVLAWLGLFFLLSYCLVVLQAYAQRLRRKVASSFFPRQEEKRIEFLIQKIVVKRK